MFFYRSHLTAAFSSHQPRKTRLVACQESKKQPGEKRISGTLSIARCQGEIEE